VRRGVRRFVALALVVVLAALPLVAAADPAPSLAGEPPPPSPAFVPFTPNIRVNSGNSTYQQQVEPTMAINSQGRLFVGWKEAFTHSGGGQRVSVSYSTDAGATWAPDVFMPLHTYSLQSDPWLMVTEDDRVFFSRIEYDGTSSPGGIAVTNTTDGVSWGATQLLGDNYFADKQTHAHDAAGNLYMVWNSDGGFPTSYDVVFSRSDDGGSSWTPKVRVPDSANGALGAFVRIGTAEEVYVTWWSWIYDDLYFDRSLDGGVTWGPDVRVNDMMGTAESPLNADPPILPAMAVAQNGTIYVVWNDYRNGRPGGVANGNFDIMFARSEDGGMTWSPSLRLNDDATTARQWMPDLAIDPFGGVHAAWMDDRNGGHDVYYVNSTDGGTTWGPNVRVSEVSTPLFFWRPGDYLALESDSNGHIYVAWTDGRNGDHDIYFARLERTTGYVFDTSPAGLTVEIDGIRQTAPVALTCIVGSLHSASAPSPQGSGATRYRFLSWSDGQAQTHGFGCDAPGVYTAYFATDHEVTIDTDPPNLEIVRDGIASIAPITTWWTEGEPHEVDAPSPQGVGPTRFLFEGWSDGGTQSHLVNTTGPATLVAYFRTQFHLAVQSPYGVVACSAADCWYDAGGTATFSVAPDTVDGPTGTRYVFREWTRDASGTSASESVAMDGPRDVTAVWGTEHRLTVQSAYGVPTGNGWYEEGTPATFSVSPVVVDDASGTRFAFRSWSGDASGSAPIGSLAMDAPRTVTAVWGTEHRLTVQSEHGTTQGEGWYPAGAPATFSVSPDIVDDTTGTRYVFREWTGDASGTDPSGNVEMDRTRDVVAAWTREYRLTIQSDFGTPIGAGWHAAGEIATASIEETVVVNGITYRFLGWSGDTTGSDPSVGVLMDAPKTLVALWEEVPQTPPRGSAVDLPVWLAGIIVAFLILALFLWRRRKKEEPTETPPPA